jgi:hypothetical protein
VPDSSLELGYRWQPVPARVDLRPKAGWQAALEKASGKGKRVSPSERHTVMTYSFGEVRQVLPAVPGVYLIEAFARIDEREQESLWFYVGMSSNLKRRFEGHEQQASALMRHLNDTIGAEDSWLRVSVQLGHWMKHAGEAAPVDMSSSLVRVLFEHAAIADYRRQHPDTPLVNIET